VVSRYLTRCVRVTVADDEIAVRAIMTPHHLNKKRTGLTRKAFVSPAEVDEVSVSRQPYVAAWIAKLWARAVVQSPPDKVYVGLAFIDVQKVRQAGSDVFDSRSEYLGHGDIRHGIVMPKKGVPLPPPVLLQLDTQLDAIVNAAHFVHDAKPRSLRWSE
jgi:hypothetical protein